MRFTFFRPAAMLMNKMNYLLKFFVVAALLLIPLGILLYILTTNINKTINFSSKELTGISYNATLRQLLEKVQLHREHSLQFFMGDSSAQNLMIRSQREIENAILGVDSVDTQYGDALAVREQWKNIKIDWKNLKSRAFTHKMEKSDELHNKLASDILALVIDVSDNSNLTLDSDIETYYLMQITNFKALQLTEALSKSKNLLRKASTTTILPPDMRTEFTVLTGIIQPLLADIADGVNRINTYNQPVAPLVEPSYVDLKSTTDQYVEILQSEILIDSLRSNRGDNLQILERPISAGFEVFDVQLPILKNLVEQRIAQFENQRLFFFIATPLIIFLVAYLLGGFYSSVIGTVSTLESVAHQLEEGKITEVVEVETNDELGRVGKSFNRIAVSLLQRNKDLENHRVQLETTNSQLRETQTALVQGEKMASLGQMVAGLAHEINTPLGYVKNNIEMMINNHMTVTDAVEKYRKLLDMLVNGVEEGLEETVTELANLSSELEKNTVMEDGKTMLSQALVGTERIQELIKNLREFSRLDEADLSKVDLNTAVDATLVIANNVIKNKAVVKKDYQPNLTAECYPAQYNQVILNLLTNAAQAIEGQGTITIRTYKEPGNPDMAVVRIADTGKGISREHLGKIFEPFFTTKKIGEGTGLGLSIAYKIIEKHGGSIKVDSEVGRGTEFTVRIPVVQPRIGKQQQSQAAPVMAN
ncbi:MAG: ATP-binding protein [Bacteroidota bacterium]